MKIQNLPDKIRVARENKSNNMVISFIKQGWIKKFIKYENGISQEIEFEEAIKLIEAKVDEKSITIPKDYFNGLNSNKEAFNAMIEESMIQGVHETSSPNEKKVRKYLKALLVQDISTVDREYLVKVDSAIKRGSLNARVFKDIAKELNKKNRTIADLVMAFKNIIDEVYLVERKNYDVMDSLKKQRMIVSSEYLVSKEN